MLPQINLALTHHIAEWLNKNYPRFSIETRYYSEQDRHDSLLGEYVIVIPAVLVVHLHKDKACFYNREYHYNNPTVIDDIEQGLAVILDNPASRLLQELVRVEPTVSSDIAK